MKQINCSPLLFIMNSKQFKEIYYPCHEKLYRIAYRLLMDIHAAEDAVQETYLKLWDKRQGLDVIGQPEAYAVTLLRNICLNQIRWRSDKNMVNIGMEIPEDESLSTQIDQNDEAKYLLQLIERLPEQQKQIMTLRHCEEFTYEEIADMTGLDIKYLRVIISRARKTLREQFEKVNSYGYK